jgi:hypothetical protein
MSGAGVSGNSRFKKIPRFRLILILIKERIWNARQ